MALELTMTMKRRAKAVDLLRGGDANEIRKNLASFEESAAVFSSNSPRLIDKYENRWVGVHDGKIAASGKTLASVTRKIAKQGIPPGETMIRRVDRKEKTMILVNQ